MAKRIIASQVDDSEWQIIEEEDQGYQVIGEAYKENYANLFQAAPEMYEALKEWSALEEVMKECGYCADDYIECDIHQGQLQQIIKMRDAALLKAEGREV